MASARDPSSIDMAHSLSDNPMNRSRSSGKARCDRVVMPARCRCERCSEQALQQLTAMRTARCRVLPFHGGAWREGAAALPTGGMNSHRFNRSNCI